MNDLQYSPLTQLHKWVASNPIHISNSTSNLYIKRTFNKLDYNVLISSVFLLFFSEFKVTRCVFYYTLYIYPYKERGCSFADVTYLSKAVWFQNGVYFPYHCWRCFIYVKLGHSSHYMILSGFKK